MEPNCRNGCKLCIYTKYIRTQWLRKRIKCNKVPNNSDKMCILHNYCNVVYGVRCAI